MNTITIQDIKRNGTKVIAKDKPTYLIVNSKVTSVLIPPDEYEMLIEALEDLEDIQLSIERMKEPTYSFEQVDSEISNA